MDYEKKYKELVGKIDKAYLYAQTDSTKAVLKEIHPELKESEDETIRKDILAFIKNNAVGEHNWHKWLAWLENQGEQKLIEKYGIKDIGSKNAQGKLGEMIKNLKPADKVEPKFHEGDFVINSHGFIMKIVGTIEQSYQYIVIDNNEEKTLNCSFSKMEESCRLWDITKDAKDGDVLAVEPENGYPSPFIAIYKERGLDYFNSHCFIGFDAKFYTGDTGHDMIGIHPATKEQRDTLEKAMADAGYEWNAEKKELKKIEQKPAWSEEDEKTINNICHIIRQYDKISKRENKPCWYIGDCLLWMQNIKDRVQPKQEWSGEDEYCRHQLIVFCENCMVQDSNAKKCANWLKSLRPQKLWKPSDEQMDALHYVTNFDYGGHKATLVSLYEQLKKLKR